jgi:hypothetical protein
MHARVHVYFLTTNYDIQASHGYIHIHTHTHRMLSEKARQAANRAEDEVARLSASLEKEREENAKRLQESERTEAHVTQLSEQLRGLKEVRGCGLGSHVLSWLWVRQSRAFVVVG